MADGNPSLHGPVTHTTTLHLTISDHHHENISLHVTKLQTHAVILGIDWLHTHNPAINWRRHIVSFQDDFCNKSCLENYQLVSLETLASDLRCDALEPSVDDYHLCQLISEFCEKRKSDLSCSQDLSDFSCIPDLSAFSLSLNALESVPHPVIPEAYAEFAPLFQDKDLGTLPPHRPYDHSITLEPGSQVPFGPLYTLSQKELEELRAYIDDNLKKGFIRRSESPAGAPVLFVPKKDSKLRLCVDYRGLNKITVKNRCPLPLISETLDRLSTAKIFTKLDLKGAYNLVRVAKGDEWKTAFRTRYGHFEYLVMPFGLTNAPATFQAFLNDVLRECLDTVVVIYLDDILIYSPDEESHTTHVRRVLQLLADAQLQVNLEKCQFHVSEVEFLGYVISPKGISMDPAKVQAIVNWPVPKCVRDIQVFLGFSNFYRRFIKNFSARVAAITRFLKKNVSFVWDNLAQKAFDTLREAFISAPILVHFDPSKPCFIEPDASKYGIGAVISQPDENGVLHPIAFYSRSLSPAEKNYHIHDTELLAALEGLENWRHYLAYSDHPATILTDHKNLEYFSEKRSLSERQIRYAERLSKFKIVLAFRPGVQNGAADALSRIHSSEEGEGTIQDTLHDALLPKPVDFLPWTLAPVATESVAVNAPGLVDRIKASYPEDELLQGLIRDLTRDKDAHDEYTIEDGLLFYQGRIAVPADEAIKRDILVTCHDSVTAGHFGTFKTHELVSRSYHWPKLRQFVKKYVTSCDTCQRNKSSRHKPYGLLQPLPVPVLPWSSISMDFIVQLPESKGHTSILVVVDRLTKMAHFIPTTDDVDAEGTVSLFLSRIVAAHGLPDDIVSDRGTTFVAQFTQSVMEALGVKQNLSTAFHPQTDGQTERTNATLEQYLRCFINYQQDNWSDLLPLAELCYNNTVHASTEETPFYALHGYHPRFSVETPRVAASSPLAQERLKNLHEVQEDLKFHIKSAQETQERYYNQHVVAQPPFAPGDQVWLVRKNIKTTRPSDKLDAKKLGPFTILEAVNTRSFRLELPHTMSKVHPVFHVSLLERFQANTIEGRTAPIPPPIEIDGELEWEVEEIVDSRLFRKSHLQYRVRWKGYPDLSWEPAANVAECQQLLEAFHSRYPHKPGPASSLSVIAP